MRNTILGVCFALITSYSWPSYAEALKACFTRWEPYSYADTNNIAQGFSIDIYKEALKRAGLTATFTEMPWERCLRNLEQGVNDIAVDGNESIKNSIVSQLKPIPWVLAIWTNQPSNDKTFTHYSQLEGEVVGHVRGFAYPKEFTDNPRIKFHAVIDDTQGLRMLHHKRYDYYFGDLVNNQYLRKKYDYSVSPMLPPAKIEYLDLTFHQSLPEEQKRYEIALKSLFEDGTVQAAYKRYLGVEFEQFISNNELAKQTDP
ncbi:transporter substrate-binding domain-containing protein [Vibrio sp. T187]|uniref:substrate-binding periplasmic protein n=1 Tax=Vibrio TaxID=662 RepID=UPI0010C9A498|nr:MULTISPECIES: transporter substrate-binding domain-containing protein [Vibrio]MBW3696882.1 transporter substrate-binding domain-containing protein [Vibrio sp. T187]